MITPSRMADLTFTPVGNPATHLTHGDRRAARHDRDGHRLRQSLAELNVPEIPEILDQIVRAGGHLWACQMSADMQHLTQADLHGQVEGIIRAAEFVEKTDGAQLLFI